MHWLHLRTLALSITSRHSLTPSGTSTPRLRICSNTCPSPTSSSSRETSTTVNSLMIAMRPSTHPSPLRSDPSLRSPARHPSPPFERSSRMSLSVSPRASERSSTRKSPDGRSQASTPSSCSQRAGRERSPSISSWRIEGRGERRLLRVSSVDLVMYQSCLISLYALCLTGSLGSTRLLGYPTRVHCTRVSFVNVIRASCNLYNPQSEAGSSTYFRSWRRNQSCPGASFPPDKHGPRHTMG